MTDQPNLRDRAIDAVAQALNAGRYWLPADGLPIAADAVLALISPDAGYCPHCGRGDCAPTADAYEQQRKRADQAEAEVARLRDAHRFEEELSADLRARLKATSDACSDATTAPAALHEGEEPHPDERIVATPAQWIWQWNRATPEQRLDMAGRIQHAFDTASRCFLEAHASRAEDGRAAIAAVGRVHTELDRWSLNTITPQTGRALDDIRAALDNRSL